MKGVEGGKKKVCRAGKIKDGERGGGYGNRAGFGFDYFHKVKRFKDIDKQGVR